MSWRQWTQWEHKARSWRWRSFPDRLRTWTGQEGIPYYDTSLPLHLSRLRSHCHHHTRRAIRCNPWKEQRRWVEFVWSQFVFRDVNWRPEQRFFLGVLELYVASAKRNLSWLVRSSGLSALLGTLTHSRSSGDARQQVLNEWRFPFLHPSAPNLHQLTDQVLAFVMLVNWWFFLTLLEGNNDDKSRGSFWTSQLSKCEWCLRMSFCVWTCGIVLLV